jgi:hypothetical protein
MFFGFVFDGNDVFTLDDEWAIFGLGAEELGAFFKKCGIDGIALDAEHHTREVSDVDQQRHIISPLLSLPVSARGVAAGD